MLKWIILWSLLSCCVCSWAQSDSIRVVISLDAANDKIETAKGYWDARANLDVQLDMYGFIGGKHLAYTFPLAYDQGEDAWVTMAPKGYFELRVNSLGFTDIKYPMRLKEDHREEFKLEVDSVLYTYKNRKRYNYIGGTRRFCATLIVQFKEGDPAENRAFLVEALALEGLEHLNVLRTQKMRHVNTFLVTLDIADQTPLNLILYRKMTRQSPPERGYVIGPSVTKAIELFQANPNVRFANPSFLEDPTQVFEKSVNYPKSEQLERKLLRLMEEDNATLDKINYIIQETTPKETVTEELE